MQRTTLLYLLVAFFTFSAAKAQNKTTQIDSLMHRASRIGLFNGNILVIDNNKVEYHAAIGFADASKKTLLSEQYRFHIGSIAKEFNAVGIMMLKEQGKLKLDDKVSKYISGLPAWADKVSILNLLQYTSGLPDLNWKTAKNDADIMADLQKLQKLDFEPGTNYAYNNNNVFLQRRIIEKITGTPFNRFVMEKELLPSGIKNSIIDPTDKSPLVAMAYNNAGKQDELNYPITGWTCVNLQDFYKWAKVIGGFKLINSESTNRILVPVGPDRQAGLGGGGMENGKVLAHVHDGSSLNYNALLASYPQKGRAVIIMINNKQGNIYNFNTSIQNILDGKPYSDVKKSILTVYANQLLTMTGEQVLAFYHKLKLNHPDEYGFGEEATLNEIGYHLAGNNKLADAIVVFEYNTKLFPSSGNVFDSLGEAYLNQGNKEKALLNYKRSVQFDPSNTAAKEVIARLEK